MLVCPTLKLKLHSSKKNWIKGKVSVFKLLILKFRVSHNCDLEVIMEHSVPVTLRQAYEVTVVMEDVLGAA